MGLMVKRRTLWPASLLNSEDKHMLHPAQLSQTAQGETSMYRVLLEAFCEYNAKYTGAERRKAGLFLSKFLALSTCVLGDQP